ncbi:MAG: hypothetical protein ACNA8P_03145 [Phycisphaerales bacterium]
MTEQSRLWRVGVAGCTAAMVVALAGCAGSAEKAGGKVDSHNSLLEDGVLAHRDPPRDAFDESVSLLWQALGQRDELEIELELEPAPQRDRQARERLPDRDSEVVRQSQARANLTEPVSVEEEAEPEVEIVASVSEGDGLATGMAAPVQVSVQERVSMLAADLADALRDLADERPNPVGVMLRLSMLEAIEPGVLERVFGPLDSAAAVHRLTEDERLLINAARRAVESVQAQFDGDFVDSERVSRVARELADELRAVHTLELSDARLCLRVDNFGVYREVERHDGRYKFIAGRAHPVIVYTELDHFRRSPTTRDGVDGYVVNVHQALKMYRTGTMERLDTENTLVWQLEAQPVVDFSRNRLNDFFVVQVIELPQTLSVGSYRLKVIATDVASSEQVERSIEFDVIADSSALREWGYGGGADLGRYNPDRR